MLGRKPKSQPEQEAGRRQVQRAGSSPAFSYYTARITDGPREQRVNVRDRSGQVQRPSDVPSGTEGVPRPARLRAMLVGLPFWLLVIVAAVCAAKMLMLSDNPKIVIVGQTKTTATYMQAPAVYESAAHKLLAASVANRSKLTVDTDGVARSISQEFPELGAVSISIPLVASRPVVYVQPASPSLVLEAAHGNYALNATGVVLSRLKALPPGVPQVVDQSGLAPYPGKQVLPSGTVRFVQTVAYQFNAQHLAISTFVLPAASPYELDVRLEGQPYAVRFNLEADARTQSGAAIATIQHLGGVVPAAYIDVRASGRVYYK